MAIAKKSSNLKNPKNEKELENIKSRINKRFEDIEQNFYQIGVDLIKANMMVKNFRKWVKENTTMGKSTAYTLMKIVKMDKQLFDSKSYNSAKRKISFYKLVQLLKYPTDFLDKLNFKKMYEVPGGKKFNLIEMPRELFSEVIAHEYRMLNAKNSDEEDVAPTDEKILSKAKQKLDKLLKELENIATVLAEIKSTKRSKDAVNDAVSELESINAQAANINDVVSKLLSSLQPRKRTRKAA